MSHNKLTVNSQTPSAAGDISLASTDLSDTADLARLASPALTGTPTAPTAPAATNNTQLATTQYVDSAVSAGGAPTVRTVASQGSNYAITTHTLHHEIFLITPTADIDVTLPAAGTAGSGYRYDIKNLASGFTLTLKGQSGENIDGVAPATGVLLASQYESLTLVSSGADWYII